jgi:isocitrate/isopropylmalate dehydrogenase
LLDWRGRRDNEPRLLAGAAAIEDATDQVLADPATRTRDLGGELGTTQFGAAVCAAIRRAGGSFPTGGAVTVPGELR